jgi:hypothetical protein
MSSESSATRKLRRRSKQLPWLDPDNIDELRRHIEGRLSAFRGSYETETTVDEMIRDLDPCDH